MLVAIFCRRASIVRREREGSSPSIDAITRRIEFDSFLVERLEVAEIVAGSTSDPMPMIN